MIVWGGWGDETGDNAYADGAAFDPVANKWRVIAESPLPRSWYHLATWTGSEMLVFSGFSAAAYDPVGDVWRTLAAPPFPLRRQGFLDPISGVWAQDTYVAWDSFDDRVVAYSPATDEWTEMPPVEIDVTRGVLRFTGESIFAFGTDVNTRRPILQGAELKGTSWIPTPSVQFWTSENAHGARPNLVAWAGDRFVAWSDGGRGSEAFMYTPGDDAWTPTGPNTVFGCEYSSSPTEMDTRVFVPSCGGQSIYDSQTDQWTRLNIDGLGEGRDTVWTGKEILVWGDTCCFGAGGEPFDVSAWRYRP